MAKETEFDVESFEPPLLVCKKEPVSPASDRAQSDIDDSDLPPLVRKEEHVGPILKASGRNFISLTQTCKQIRSEYRPLWLRNSAFRIEFVDLNKFIATFYPSVKDYSNAPKLLLIPWDHEDDAYDDTLLDITALLRFRAFCPTFAAHFKARRLIEMDLPDVECDSCGHSINCHCNSDCSHDDSIDDAMGELYMEYEYLELLNEVLANKRPAWLKTLRDKRNAIKVECTVDLETQRLTVYTRFHTGTAPRYLEKTSMFSGATWFLNHNGFLDLALRKDMDFVVGEATGKFTRHLEGCRTLVPTFNQVELPGDTLYKLLKMVVENEAGVSNHVQ